VDKNTKFSDQIVFVVLELYQFIYWTL